MRTTGLFALLFLLAACTRREPAAPPEAKSSAPAPTPVAGVADSGPGSTSPATKDTAAPADAISSIDGEQLFQTHCAQCHMANGSGVPFLQPDIRHSAWISAENPQLLLSLILHGSAVLGEAANAYENDMPPFEHLSDAEIAALATRVREKFATPKPAKPVTPADVATARARPGLPE